MSCSGDPRDLHSFPTRRSSDLHSTRNKTRDGLIRVRNIRALNGRFNTSITHAYSIESAIQGSDRKSGSAGMPRPISYAVFCLKKKKHSTDRLAEREAEQHIARD